MASDLPQTREACVALLRGKNVVPQPILRHIHAHHAPHQYGRFRSVVPLSESEKHSMLQLDTVCTDAWLRRLMPEKLETDRSSRRKGGRRGDSHVPRACERNYFSVNFAWENAVLVQGEDGTVTTPTLALRANLKAQGRDHFDAFDRGVRVMTLVGKVVLVTTPRAIAFCNVNVVSRADQAIRDCRDKIREGLSKTRTRGDAATLHSPETGTDKGRGKCKRKRKRSLTKQTKDSSVVAMVNLAALQAKRRGSRGATPVGASAIAHMFGHRRGPVPCVTPACADRVA